MNTVVIMSFLTLQKTSNRPLKYIDYDDERINEGKHEINVKFGCSAVLFSHTLTYVSLGS